MRMLGIVAWTALVLALGASLAHAKGEYSRPGPHASLQVVFAVPTWEDTLRGQLAVAAPAAAPADLSMSGGIDLRVGYRFHERVAAEMGFDWVSAYGISQLGVDTGEAANWMYYVDAKLFLATEKLQPFLLLGMGAYHLDYAVRGTPVFLDATSFSPRLGGGVDYHIDYRFGLTAELDYVIGTRQLVNRDRVTVSVGAFFRY